MERVVIHGGAAAPDAIGASCYSIDTYAGGGSHRILVDYGVEAQFRKNGTPPRLPDLSLLDDGKPIDAVIITHAHTDHIGGLGYLARSGLLAPNARIFMAPQTHAALGTILEESHSGLPPNDYDFIDEMNVRERATIVREPGEVEILPGLRVFTSPAGHVPGAMSVIIPTASGRKGLITGDICWDNQPVTMGAPMPSQTWPQKWIPDEVWGTDLTYGHRSREKSPWEEAQRLVAAASDAIRREETVIVAAFGYGRGQNVACWLSWAGIPVLLDGSIRSHYQNFQNNRWTERDPELPLPGTESGIQFVKDRQEVIHSLPEPKVVVTTAGMGDFGAISDYLIRYLPDSTAHVFFTSWLAPGTLGKQLVCLGQRRSARLKTVRIEPKGRPPIRVPVLAQIDRFGLSAHGTVDQFADFLQDIGNCRGEPLDRLVLTHGIKKSKRDAREFFRQEGLAKDIVVGEPNQVFPI